MRAITFEVHPITPSSPRIHTCNHIKHIYPFCFLFFFAYFLLISISCMGIQEKEKKYPMILSFYIKLLLCRSIKMSFHDWRATVVRWLFLPFSQHFLVLPVKKSDTSVKYKRLLNLTHHKHEPQSSLAQFAQIYSFKLQKIQSLENFVSMAIQGTQVSMYTNTLFLYFFDPPPPLF